MIRTRQKIAEVNTIKKQIAAEILYDYRFQGEERGKRMTQKEFAEQVGLAQNEVSELLRGKLGRFTTDRLFMVLIALGHKPIVSVC